MTDCFKEENGRIRILEYPDDRLYAVSTDVETFEEAKEIEAKLLQALNQGNWIAGLGLSAPQIGIFKRVFIFTNKKKEKQLVVNPKIVARRGNITFQNEGCLSVPDFLSDVKRSKFVKVEHWLGSIHYDFIKANILEAVQLQHEIDHLDGKLFIDRLKKGDQRLKKYKAKRQEKIAVTDPNSATNL